MVSKITRIATATLATVILGSSAQAALLNLTAPVLPAVQAGTSMVVFDPFLGFVGTGPDLATAVALLDVDGTLLGGDFSTSIGGASYFGSITDVGFEIDASGTDTIQFLVDLSGGPFLEGGLVTYTGEFGSNPSAPFAADFADFSASFALQPIGIPLPAALPLAVASLGALAMVGRGRRALQGIAARS